MTISTIIRTVAIREDSLKFAWCGHIKHFRQVHCYLGEKPICKECADFLNLKLVAREKKVKPKSEKKEMRTSVIEKMATRTYRICQALQDKCLSTSELYQVLNEPVSYETFACWLRKLVLQGVLIARRKDRNLPNFYALPDNASGLCDQTGGVRLEEIILNLLTSKPHNIPQLVRATQKTRPSIYGAIKRLEGKGLVSTQMTAIKGVRGISLMCSLKPCQIIRN